MNIDTTTKTVERHYTIINGEEIQTAHLIDFLEGLEGTSPAETYRWRPIYHSAAEALIEEDVVGRTNSGSWFVKDETRREELLHTAFDQYDEWREE